LSNNFYAILNQQKVANSYWMSYKTLSRGRSLQNDVLISLENCEVSDENWGNNQDLGACHAKYM